MSNNGRCVPQNQELCAVPKNQRIGARCASETSRIAVFNHETSRYNAMSVKPMAANALRAKAMSAPLGVTEWPRAQAAQGPVHTRTGTTTAVLRCNPSQPTRPTTRPIRTRARDNRHARTKATIVAMKATSAKLNTPSYAAPGKGTVNKLTVKIDLGGRSNIHL